MTTQMLSWESLLLSWAHQCTEEDEVSDRFEANPAELDHAYQVCDGLTFAHSRTFHMASTLLPKPKYRAVRALYAFCRRTDDMVDRPVGNPRVRPERLAKPGIIFSTRDAVIRWHWHGPTLACNMAFRAAT